MNITIVTPQMIVGGAETYVLFKSRWLVEHGHSVTVISGGGENVQNFDPRVRHIEFRTEVSAASFSQRGYEAYLKELSALIVASRADVVEAHNNGPAIHIPMSYKYHKTPFLVCILNEFAYKRNFLLANLTRKINQFEPLYLLAASMERYIQGKVGRKITARIIPIPMDHYDAGTGKRKEYILTVGRLADDKMYLKPLIEAFTLLMAKKKLPDGYKLHIVGDGNRRNEIEKLADQANQTIGYPAVILFGTLTGEELKQQYLEAKLFVGTGTSLLLAAGCQLPAIIPGTTPQTIPYAWGIWGETPSDYQTLAVTVAGQRAKSSYGAVVEEILVKDTVRYDAAAKRARELFDVHYSVEQIMSKWENEYRRVCASKPDEFIERLKTIKGLRLAQVLYKLVKR